MSRLTLRDPRTVSIVFMVVASALFTSSLFVCACSQNDMVNGHALTGIECLLAPLFHPTAFFNPVWWANPAFVVAVVALFGNQRERANFCGIAAMLLALVGSVYFWSDALKLLLFIPLGGFYEVEIGFYLWFFAICIMACSVPVVNWLESSSRD
jgi:hypothetical protein